VSRLSSVECKRNTHESESGAREAESDQVLSNSRSVGSVFDALASIFASVLG
jgi:hypothetical protein